MTDLDGFYRGFEERFRGSRADIRGRLTVYLPLLKNLAARFPSGKAIDLGCGRCEWLELLSEQGLQAKGVDLDAHMLADCRERSLNVEQGDAIEVLAAAPDNSHALVSGFHIAEHLPFDALMRLVTEANRVLHPGGVLLLETPNPENIRVSTRDFYLDPTHRHPLPPALLGFVYEFAGFEAPATLRLGEPAGVHDKPRLSLHDVVSSVSPDYAVLGVSGREPQAEQVIQQLVRSHSGVDLDAMIARYHQAEEERCADIDGHLRRLLARQEGFESRQEDFEVRQGGFEVRQGGFEAEIEVTKEQIWHFADIERHLHRLASQQELFEAELEATKEHNRHLHEELLSVYTSRSWRLTRPYRLIGRAFLSVKGRLSATRLPRWVSSETLLQWIERHPVLKGRLIAASHRLGMSSRLRRIYHRLNRRRLWNAPSSSHEALTPRANSPEVLTPRARRLSERLFSKGKK